MQGHESHTSLKPGVSVEVTGGMARGAIGRIKEQWPRPFSRDIRQWLVTFDGLIPQRVLREDYLKVLP